MRIFKKAHRESHMNLLHFNNMIYCDGESFRKDCINYHLTRTNFGCDKLFQTQLIECDSRPMTSYLPGW